MCRSYIWKLRVSSVVFGGATWTEATRIAMHCGFRNDSVICLLQFSGFTSHSTGYKRKHKWRKQSSPILDSRRRRTHPAYHPWFNFGHDNRKYMYGRYKSTIYFNLIYKSFNKQSSVILPKQFRNKCQNVFLHSCSFTLFHIYFIKYTKHYITIPL